MSFERLFMILIFPIWVIDSLFNAVIEFIKTFLKGLKDWSDYL